MVEYRSPKPGVGGSSPSWPANFFLKSLKLESVGYSGFLNNLRNTMSEKKIVMNGAEVKTLSRSEQRRKNRLEGKGRRKNEDDAAETRPDNIFIRTYNFFLEAREELERVIWPTRQETINSTWRLLILVIIAGLYLGLVDGILTRLLAVLVKAV